MALSKAGQPLFRIAHGTCVETGLVLTESLGTLSDHTESVARNRLPLQVVAVWLLSDIFFHAVVEVPLAVGHVSHSRTGCKITLSITNGWVAVAGNDNVTGSRPW